MTQKEIQKQIEAVRGLILSYNGLSEQDMQDIDKGLFVSQLGILHSSLKNLAQTLKPYLNGEKLEV